MNYISTTDLRLQSRKLVQSLRQGVAVTLIHRSDVIGVISPITVNKQEKSPKQREAALREFFVKAQQNHNASLSLLEQDAIYKKHMEEKHGKPVS